MSIFIFKSIYLNKSNEHSLIYMSKYKIILIVRGNFKRGIIRKYSQLEEIRPLLVKLKKNAVAFNVISYNR